MADLVRDLRPSVVLVLAKGASGLATGSGVIYAEDGRILTNYHVVAGSTAFAVRLQESDDVEARVFDAELLGYDAEVDLAVLKIGDGPFRAARLGGAGQLSLGDTVVALGFPLADQTGGSLVVTEGIVSSKRSDGLREVIQHQASVNPGNSGGPLVDMDGEIVGINTYVVRRSQADDVGIEGFNLAVAIDEATSRLASLETGALVGAPTAEQTITNETFGFALTLPPGWNVTLEEEDTLFAASPELGAFFALVFDVDHVDFEAPDEWAAYWYEVGATDLEGHELVVEDIDVDEDGNPMWLYLESYLIDGVPYACMEAFFYHPEFGMRMYLESPDAVFETAVEDFEIIADSFTEF